MKFIKFLLLSLVLISFIEAQVKDNTFNSADKSQVSDELKETEFIMNTKVAVLNGLLNQYYKTLIKMSKDNTLTKTITVKDDKGKDKKIEVERIKYSPSKTKVWRAKDKDNNDYIIMESYTFIPEHYTSNVSIGTRLKRLKLTFNGSGKLIKVYSIIISDNFRDEEKIITEVWDDSPTIIPVKDRNKDKYFALAQKKYLKMSNAEKKDIENYNKNMNDIRIRYTFNKKKPYDVKLENMENTITNPLRLKFKRQFYIIHLKYFEKLFRYTEEFQRKFNTNKDAKTLDYCKKSLGF